MILPDGIIITGLNGCGKSTVCKLLAKKINYYSMDVEDYYFIESDIPYSKFHTHEQTKKLMLDDILKHNHFVLATVNCDWGEEILSMCKLAVLLKAPLDIRMERIRKREYEKFGTRVLNGGDLYESQHKFHNKVLSRGENHMTEQMRFVDCPVLELDATLPIYDIVNTIFKKCEQLNMIMKDNECQWCNLTPHDKKWLLYETEFWDIYLSDRQDYIGRCILVSKRHCGSLSELNHDEWLDLKDVIDDIENVMKKVLSADLCNWSCLMNDFYKNSNPNPHLHIHIRPRLGTPVNIGGKIISDDEFGHHYDNQKQVVLNDKEINILYKILKSEFSK